MNEQLDLRLVNIAVVAAINGAADPFDTALRALELPDDFIAERHQLAFDHRMQVHRDEKVESCAACGTAACWICAERAGSARNRRRGAVA